MGYSEYSPGVLGQGTLSTHPGCSGRALPHPLRERARAVQQHRPRRGPRLRDLAGNCCNVRCSIMARCNTIDRSDVTPGCSIIARCNAIACCRPIICCKIIARCSAIARRNAATPRCSAAPAPQCLYAVARRGCGAAPVASLYFDGVSRYIDVASLYIDVASLLYRGMRCAAGSARPGADPPLHAAHRPGRSGEPRLALEYPVCGPGVARVSTQSTRCAYSEDPV